MRGSRRNRTPAAGQSSGGSSLLTFLALAVIGAFIFAMIRRENERAYQQHEADRAVEASRGAVFARGDLTETLELCSEGWQNRMGLYHTPIAIAWTRTAVDAYFLSGVDAASVRQIRCDAKGLEMGPRVAFPIEEKLPAEAAEPENAEGAQADWQAAIDRTATGTFQAGEVAVELLRHPFTGRALTRRWRGGPEGATATLDPPDAAPFAFLPASTTFPVVGKAPPSLRPLERKRWITQSSEAFSLLARELPKGALISELTLSEDEIEVQIAHETPAFDGRPPVPYGDKEFDEYGIADAGYWYPREIPGFGCGKGATLAEVITTFGVAKRLRGSEPITTAWFSCSTAYSNGRTGVWHFMPSR
jgi:hypothetical protein